MAMKVAATIDAAASQVVRENVGFMVYPASHDARD
jgi:hypothetical protein